jgi:hypothetical protein
VDIAIEKLVAISFFVIGLSHIFQPRAWIEFFIRFRDKGAVGSLQLGLLHLPLALLIVSFHNIWHGLPVVVTLVGWGQLLKSFLYLMYPKHGLRMLSLVSIERSWQFVLGGMFAVAISGVIFFSLWQRS